MQHKWQFQVGVGLFIFPFLYQIYNMSKIFNKTMADDNGIKSNLIQNHIETHMNLSSYCIPIQVIGVALILLTLFGVFGKTKNKISNKKETSNSDSAVAKPE